MIVTILALVITSSWVIKQKVNNSCSDWLLGLKDTEMDNRINEECQLFPPSTCYFKIFYGLFDLSFITGKTTCSKDRADNFQLNYIYLKEEMKSARLIGFPRTEHLDLFESLSGRGLQKNIIENLIDMEKASDKEKEDIEAVINLIKNPPELLINLKKNETLIKERTKIFEQYKNEVLTKNVFYLFLDSLSRVNFRRKLPKFYKWIENKYIIDDNNNNNKNNGNEKIKKSQKHESFQFFKHHGVGYYTEQNMVPSMFGTYNNDKGGIHFLKYYIEKGYIAGQALNSCSNEIFAINKGTNLELLEWARFDHEFFTPVCDLNYFTKNDGYDIRMGANSMFMRCLYGKQVIEHSMDYAYQFMYSYKSEAKIFKLATYEGHEGTGELIKYQDDLFVEFFERLEREGLLDNTALFIQSDHGLVMMGPYSAFKLEDFWKELTLPTYFIILPSDIKDFNVYRENLKASENSLTTPFCVYRSLIAILNDSSINTENNTNPPIDNRIYDLFNQKIPRDRTCNAFSNLEKRSFFSGICKCD